MREDAPVSTVMAPDLASRVVEQLETGIFVCDAALQRVVYANPGAIEFLCASGDAPDVIGPALGKVVADNLRDAQPGHFPRSVAVERGSRFYLRAKYLAPGDWHVLVNVARHVSREQETRALLHRRFGLSGREVEVVQWLNQGFTNEQLARQLKLSIGTIKQHLDHIFAAVGVRSRTQLVAMLRQVAEEEMRR